MSSALPTSNSPSITAPTVTENRVAPFASKPAPTKDLCRSQIPCGSGLAREGVPTNTHDPPDSL
ncbi:hypothetical protein CP335_00770 [Pseudomonas fluorescens]|uniref:Uncharacterized protein n=1 Tax=Pseudomonas fluorescens TaxID=294 RepID=A0A854X801_PSEFL|nr:hypothetical protein CP335_00770 [Pseudomonas fluorescens]